MNQTAAASFSLSLGDIRGMKGCRELEISSAKFSQAFDGSFHGQLTEGVTDGSQIPTSATFSWHSLSTTLTSTLDILSTHTNYQN